MISLSNLLKLILEQQRKRVVRNGKIVNKIICPPGKKIVNGRCVQMTSIEKVNRKKSAKKAAIKRKSKKSTSTRKRNLSMKKRKNSGL